MGKDLLLEIGTEEIPSSFMPPAIKEFRRLATELLESNRLNFETVKTMGTPRRLTLFVDGLAQAQGDLVHEVTGPPQKVAFDSEGNPTKALEKFCARYGANPSEVSLVQKAKGEYVCLNTTEHGKKTVDLFQELLPSLILSVPFKKSMRWGNLDIRFARPIHWILALYDDKPLAFSLGDVTVSNSTSGHRFIGETGPIEVKKSADYQELLRRNYVLLDPQERRERIHEQARTLSGGVNGQISEEEDLMETLVYLTEYPVVVRGCFEERFLSLPEEVLVATMKGHQKYFAVQKAGGKGLLPYFIAVANLEAPDMGLIQKGMERVLKARLEDARFFFDEDTKAPLEENLDDLKQVIFHKKLGTSYDKVHRVRRLAEYLGEAVCPELLPVVRRAAHLCKADLVTQMVGEFPELQGVMGGIYAASSGEPLEVAQAVREHYMPCSAEGDLPETVSGYVLSLADKMDTVVGYFGIGAPISGTSDPFGLRRRAIGILRILLEKDLDISLSGLIRRSSEVLGDLLEKDSEGVQEGVTEFFQQRYQHLLLAKGYPHDTIAAVLSLEFENVPDLYKRIDVLHRMRAQPDFEKLIIGCKRAVNILHQAEKQFDYQRPDRPVLHDDFHEDAERVLFVATERVRDKMKEYMEDRDYQRILEALVALKDPIDDLFDKVMVLVDDDLLRTKRLGLLHKVSELFEGIADFSRIVF